MLQLLFFSVETWILLITLICLFVVYGKWTHGTFEKMGIPGPKPIMYLGTVSQFGKVYYEADVRCAQKYGKLFGMYEFRTPMLTVMDPDMLKVILVKECFTYFTNRRGIIPGDLYDMVSLAEDDAWRRIRNVLTPSFSTGRIKEMYKIMTQHSSNMVSSLQPQVQNGEVIRVKDLFGCYSMNVITGCLFGVNMDPEPLIQFASKMLRKSPLLFIIQACFPVVKPVFKMLGLSIFLQESICYLGEIVKMIVADHKRSPEKSGDLLQNMMDSQQDEGKRGKHSNGLTDHEIISQGIVSLFGGYDTSASTLTFLAYCLARNPEVMKRLQDEIDSTFPEGAIQYERLIEMEYLDSVVSECLRLYPTIGRLERIAKEKVEINGITIPKGMLIMVPVYALHRDPELWPEPEEFKPERFSKLNKQNINPYTYLPFGMGPRNCLGMRFAQVLVKVALVEVLHKYSFQVCEETEIPLKMDPEGFVGPLNPIKLKLAMR